MSSSSARGTHGVSPRNYAKYLYESAVALEPEENSTRTEKCMFQIQGCLLDGETAQTMLGPYAVEHGYELTDVMVSRDLTVLCRTPELALNILNWVNVKGRPLGRNITGYMSVEDSFMEKVDLERCFGIEASPSDQADDHTDNNKKRKGKKTKSGEHKTAQQPVIAHGSNYQSAQGSGHRSRGKDRR
jgi:hypothetical protein